MTQVPSEIKGRAWLSAFNAKNLESLLSLYHDNAIHLSPKLRARKPETKGLIQGKAALADWWREAFTRLPELNYCLVRFTTGPAHLFIEYTRQNPGEEDLSVAELLEFNAEGLIVRSRVYHG